MTKTNEKHFDLKKCEFEGLINDIEEAFYISKCSAKAYLIIADFYSLTTFAAKFAKYAEKERLSQEEKKIRDNLAAAMYKELLAGGAYKAKELEEYFFMIVKENRKKLREKICGKNFNKLKNSNIPIYFYEIETNFKKTLYALEKLEFITPSKSTKGINKSFLHNWFKKKATPYQIIVFLQVMGYSHL